MSDCEIGVALDNTVIGDQGNASTPSDNEWFNSESFDIVRLGGSRPEWFYRIDDGNSYIPLPSQAAIFPQLVQDAPDNCPDTQTPCDPGCIGELIVPYTNIDNAESFSGIASAAKFIAQQLAYEWLKADTTIMHQNNQNDSILQAFYDTISVMNTGILNRVNELIAEGSLGSASTLNASINPDNLLEENHQTFNNIYLETLAENIDTLNVMQKDDLIAIAEQCPLSGGMAVYQARAMLSLVLDSIVNYDEENCEEQINLRIALIKKYESVKIPKPHEIYKLYPNPNNGNMQLDYKLSNGESGELMLFDSFGRKLCNYQLNKAETTLVINDEGLAGGIYVYQVKVNGRIRISEKLIILK